MFISILILQKTHFLKLTIGRKLLTGINWIPLAGDSAVFPGQEELAKVLQTLVDVTQPEH